MYIVYYYVGDIHHTFAFLARPRLSFVGLVPDRRVFDIFAVPCITLHNFDVILHTGALSVCAGRLLACGFQWEKRLRTVATVDYTLC